jgi:hypothetical protein
VRFASLPELIDEVNSRIDQAIQANATQERLIWIVLSVTFLAGIFVLIYGVMTHDKYLVGASLGANALTCWSIHKLREFYCLKISLAAVPQMTALLSHRDAAVQISGLIRQLIKKL